MAKMNVDTALIRELAALLDETNLTEIEVSEEGRSIRVARQGGPVVAAAPVIAAAPAALAAPVAVAPGGAPAVEAGTVTSPMVGTVYLQPEPGAPPFVSVGDTVAKGQTLLIVEAMKTMNPIPAPHAGRVEKILVANGQPVEYGEALLVVR
ncbi:acetyl-CoA carboxylase biotin carboxyl carrier protein [Zavarzinia sp. CC-PAN008]|uniref:acetyl-CoA carboxylase biotin carboxyl carrier protein n=1 Tax=Zavarzinia sp. CC-PAN008 TaxID=3243332 RepID=UPI003F749C20